MTLGCNPLIRNDGSTIKFSSNSNTVRTRILKKLIFSKQADQFLIKTPNFDKQAEKFLTTPVKKPKKYQWY